MDLISCPRLKPWGFPVPRLRIGGAKKYDSPENCPNIQ